MSLSSSDNISSSSSSSDHKSHIQKETSGAMLRKSSTAPSMAEQRRKMKSLASKIDFLGDLRGVLKVLIFVVAGFSMLLLWVPVKLYGMPLYIILLSSHSIVFSCLFIVQYKLLPTLIDELSIMSHQLKQKNPCPPSYRRSKIKLLLCYLMILAYYLTIATIWIYLANQDLQADFDSNEWQKQMGICYIWGMLLLALSCSVMSNLGPLYNQPQTEEYETDHGNGNTDKRASIQIPIPSHTKDELYVERIDEITKLRNEILERDEERDKILMELSQEVKRLSRQRPGK